MPTTLTPTCPLCGLRYHDRPLLELHIREDHRPRDRHVEPGPDPGYSGDTATSPPRDRGPVRRALEALSRVRRVSGDGSDRVAGGGRA